MASLRAAGYPTTLAELEAMRPVVPDHENAARIYQEAFSRQVWCHEAHKQVPVQ